MTIITDNTKQILFVTTMALIMSACGSSSSNSNVESTQKKIAVNPCENNSMDAIEAKATLVPANATVKKGDENTSIRVWHFQNSEELICVIRGSAEIITK